jgi:hypothetical protein
MFRFLIGSEAGTPASFSAPFQGGVVSLAKPSQLFVVSPSHIAAPAMAPTTAISNKMPFLTPAPISFLILLFVRASIATIVNFQGFIEDVPVNTPRLDHDPVTLAPKGLLLEEARTNSIFRSDEFTSTAWDKFRITVSSSIFPIFTSENVLLLSGSVVSGTKVTSCNFPPFSTTFTMSVFMRRGTHNSAQIASYIDTTIFANFDLLNGVVSNQSASVSATIIPWRDGWYRCTLTSA